MANERVAGVIRLSDLTDVTTSPERQRETITLFARARGSDITLWAEDLDVSASKKGPFERPELRKVLDRPDEWDTLLFWRLDRFVRNAMQFNDMIKWCLDRGKNLVSATEPIDIQTPVGRMIANVIATFAEMEAAAISERILDAQGHLRKVGRWRGGPLPYGYTTGPYVVETPALPIEHRWEAARRLARGEELASVSADFGRRGLPVPRVDSGVLLVEDEESAAILHEVIDRVIDGESVLSVAQDLKRRGIPSPANRRRILAGKEPDKEALWRPSALIKVLRSETMRGRIIHGGEVFRNDDDEVVQVGEPLVDDATWRDLQSALDGRSHPAARRQHGTAPLLGVLRCGTCERRLYTGYHRPKGRPIRRLYKCTARTEGRVCEAPVVVAAEAAEEWVEADFLRIMGTRPVLREEVDPGEDHRSEIAELEASLDRLERDRYDRGAFDGADGESRFARLHGKYSARLRELQALPYRPPAIRRVASEETYGDMWHASGTDGRRSLLLSAGCRVVVGKTTRGARDVGARLTMEIGVTESGVPFDALVLDTAFADE